MATKKSSPSRRHPPARIRAARLLGKAGGRANTHKQRAARKRGPKFGGRPRRVCIHCGHAVEGGHVDRRRDETCGAHGWRWQQGDAPATVAELSIMIESYAAALAQLETLRDVAAGPTTPDVEPDAPPAPELEPEPDAPPTTDEPEPGDEPTVPTPPPPRIF